MNLILKTTTSLALIIAICFSCGKDDNPSNDTGKLNFSLSPSKDNEGRIEEGSFANAVAVLITIETSEGESTAYDRESIDLFEINGQLITEKISLLSGNYKLTEFLVVDAENNITHIAPLEGSNQAQNVSNPLPINFSIIGNDVTEVLVEVISTEGLVAEDFGLVGFNLTEVPVFSFLINVSEQGNLDSFLEATLNITSTDYEYTEELIAIANNSVTIKDGFDTYDIEILKEGYHSYNETYTIESLYTYGDTPLTIEITPIGIPGEDLVDARDGKTYKTIHLGTQLWMAENLRATTYNDGNPIEYPGTNITAWEDNTTGAYAWYDHTETEYGPLYNWYAVNTGKLCPTGWHIPTDEEWNELGTYLGGGSIAGSKMKETGTEHWEAPNSDATNASGFNAIPAGWAYYVNGHFSYLRERAVFWSSEEGYNADHGISRHLVSGDERLIRYTSSNSSNKGNGFSCRCIKD
ncbi:fibrobacter succinogenes major paralogous domain-containing protein [Ekhidna sp.]|uniref:fibrobacter succinogenes major paralogous domain-containing protein n=1 Tax=Ekhidna sp. TaxID=2608089 RepID=UPI0035196251